MPIIFDEVKFYFEDSPELDDPNLQVFSKMLYLESGFGFNLDEGNFFSDQRFQFLEKIFIGINNARDFIMWNEKFRFSNCPHLFFLELYKG
jgi:hypothetical protein